MQNIFFKSIDLLFLAHMKIIPKKIFLVVVFILTVSSVFAADPPDPTPPPPPGLPIDGGLLILLVAGVLLGSYTIYKNTRYKKTSV